EGLLVAAPGLDCDRLATGAGLVGVAPGWSGVDATGDGQLL
ncbi:hypothetical protein, partial [Pseudomonas sp. FEN]